MLSARGDNPRAGPAALAARRTTARSGSRQLKSPAARVTTSRTGPRPRLGPARAIDVHDEHALRTLSERALEPPPPPVPRPGERHAVSLWRAGGRTPAPDAWSGVCWAHEPEPGSSAISLALAEEREAATQAKGPTPHPTTLRAVAILEPTGEAELGPLLSLARAGRLARLAVGLEHPDPSLRGRGVAALRAAGVQVDVLAAEADAWPAATDAAPGAAGDAPAPRAARLSHALWLVATANVALLHRHLLGLPFSILKYASTADGAIAAPGGDSRWVSGPESRAGVHALRRSCDAVVVGARTLARDDPTLTTRAAGHQPTRVVVSRGLEGLPREASLWDVSTAPTIVVTAPGSDPAFRAHLEARGVEVVESPEPSPVAVARACLDRGHSQLLWEPGGTLAAAALQAGVVHALRAYVAPKIIGAGRAPSPVGDLGRALMRDALDVLEPRWDASGSDACLSGYISPSPGIWGLLRRMYSARKEG